MNSGKFELPKSRVRQSHRETPSPSNDPPCSIPHLCQHHLSPISHPQVLSPTFTPTQRPSSTPNFLPVFENRPNYQFRHRSPYYPQRFLINSLLNYKAAVDREFTKLLTHLTAPPFQFPSSSYHRGPSYNTTKYPHSRRPFRS